jgi:hypothetical protein
MRNFLRPAGYQYLSQGAGSSSGLKDTDQFVQPSPISCKTVLPRLPIPSGENVVYLEFFTSFSHAGA